MFVLFQLAVISQGNSRMPPDVIPHNTPTAYEEHIQYAR